MKYSESHDTSKATFTRPRAGKMGRIAVTLQNMIAMVHKDENSGLHHKLAEILVDHMMLYVVLVHELDIAHKRMPELGD